MSSAGSPMSSLISPASSRSSSGVMESLAMSARPYFSSTNFQARSNHANWSTPAPAFPK